MKNCKASLFLYILILNLFLIFFAGLSLVLTPYNNAPDEKTHYQYTVETILKEKRLPVWGVDDKECFKLTVSSYNRTPLFNYVIAAAGAFTAEKLGIEGFYGARVISLIWGTIFINFLFLTVRQIVQNKLKAFLITVICGCIPQVLYVFSYVNSDAHSLAFSALLGYTTLKFIKDATLKNIIFFSIMVGLMFSAKYNYFIYFPLLILVAVYLWHNNILSKKIILQTFILCFVSAILLSSFWYIRNWILYGNPLPLFIDEASLKKLGLERLASTTAKPISLSTIIELHKSAFFQKSFLSFFAMFGYMNVKLSTTIYKILEIITCLLGIYFVVIILLTKDITLKKVFFAFFVFAALLIGLHITASLKYDPQPQGRYLQPLIVPTAIFFAFAAVKQRAFFIWLIFSASLIIWLLAESSNLIIRTYYEPISFAVGYLEKNGDNQQTNLYIISEATAKRISKNNYACLIKFQNNLDIANICIKFPSQFCARYRDFKISGSTQNGNESLIYNVEEDQPILMNDTTRVLNPPAFDPFTSNAFIAIHLPPDYRKNSNLKISFDLEYRHKQNMPSILSTIWLQQRLK